MDLMGGDKGGKGFYVLEKCFWGGFCLFFERFRVINGVLLVFGVLESALI